MGLYERMIDRNSLNIAWKKVRSNHSAPGTDGVTEEDFQSRQKEMILQLQMELQEERYATRPAKLAVLEQDGSERTVGILCLRDKIVQQAICQELNRIYEGAYADGAYAYRSGRSALQAVEQAERWIQEGKCSCYLKTDIAHFFDSIRQERLLKILRQRIADEKVLHLIEICLRMRFLDSSGVLHDKTLGVYQGSVLAPVLSNIYLTDFDRWLEGMGHKYIRYSDDILILGESQDSLTQLLEKIRDFLEKYGLELKEGKTQIGELAEGIVFLGYRFNQEGKGIPAKASSRLEERLEDCWLRDVGIPIRQKLQSCREIIGGWEQYYKGSRVPGSIYEYITLLDIAPRESKKETEKLAQLEERRFQYDNVHKDILQYMAAYWKKKMNFRNVLWEYEQYYMILAFDQKKAASMPGDMVRELIDQYQLAAVNENEANFTEIMQLYTDAHCYNKARQILDWVKQREDRHPKLVEEEAAEGRLVKGQPVERQLVEGRQFPDEPAWSGHHLSEQELQNYWELFVGREDMYKRAEVRESGKIEYLPVMRPLTSKELKAHLAGEETLATLIQRNNNTVKYIVFDVDISKKELLSANGNQELREELLQVALKKAAEFQKICQNMGLVAYLEYSGGRGYHIWVFFEEWIATRYANLLQDIIMTKQKYYEPRLCVECFPNKTRIKGEKVGQGLKLPWGRHFQSGEYTYFLDGDFQFMQRQKEMLNGVAKYSIGEIKRVIAANTKEKLQAVHKKKWDLEQFGELPESIHTVLSHCGLMAYLCEKAKRTGYLPHFERLTILYVFGHMGEEGKEFVHQVMGYTLNYQYSITQKHISRLPEKPISCIKLREQYKQVTAEMGCSCSFRRTPNCYPSPVLHVIKDANHVPEGITIPASRKISQQEEKRLPQVLNVHKQAEELTHKMMELRKQERGIRRAIEKQEKELGDILDDIGEDCIELEIGILRRKKGETGWEWCVEL